MGLALLSALELDSAKLAEKSDECSKQPSISPIAGSQTIADSSRHSTEDRGKEELR